MTFREHGIDAFDALYRDPAKVQEFAVHLWENSYGADPSMSEDEALVRVQEQVVAAVDHQGVDREFMSLLVGTGWFLARWAHFALPRIQTSHRFAAALMATKVSRDVLEDIYAPWPAFEVHIPSGLLIVEGEGVFDRIRVQVLEDGTCMTTVFSTQGSWELATLSAKSLAEVLSKDVSESDVGPDERRERLWKVQLLARRLVAGLLLSMQSEPFVDRLIRGKSKPARPKVPDHRLVVVGRPLTFDARPTVEDFLSDLSGRRKPPAVLVFVIGHYKRQVCGPGGKDRKIIWIEPYPRGPEDAAFLTRPRHVGGSSA